MRRLIVLPFSKSIDIAFNSLKARFFRSIITTITLVLAVSFLTFSRVNVDIADHLFSTGNPDICRTIMRCGYDIQPGESNLCSSPKQRWIIILSLLVCVVGIINAQLMSVTERFREIGTMKCLGALDSFIVRLFILEAAMQGFAGAVGGSVIGGSAAIMGSWLRFGIKDMGDLPWQTIGASMAITVCAGVALSLIGVLYPAILAARMQPVEAMRVEQ